MKALRYLAVAALAVISGTLVRTGNAAPVEYVRICSVYGAGWFYYPGTDICVNVFTGATKKQSEVGTVSSVVTRTPGQWVTRPEVACAGGRVQSIGTFGPADLTLNVYKQAYETRSVAFQLGRKEFVSSIMMSGGFGSPATGFCVSMTDSLENPEEPERSIVLGCVDQTLLVGSPATWMFSPTRSTPPTSFVAPFYFFASNSDLKWSGPATSGRVKLSACIQTAL